VRNLVFHRLAEAELNGAAQYYEDESEGLGSAFLAAVESCTNSIVDFPELGVVIRNEIRRRLVPGFPYVVLYRIVGQDVRVLAVANSKQRPFYWSDRR
jgi:plasmid stabilization system protein ParE